MADNFPLPPKPTIFPIHAALQPNRKYILFFPHTGIYTERLMDAAFHEAHINGPHCKVLPTISV
uniref:Uncharacterized protein n=1 Tax=Octopus bimaculoides TaxID=37653 RepID=A0A0L8GDR1_OCTBM